MGRKQVRKGRRTRLTSADDTERFLARLERELKRDRELRAEPDDPEERVETNGRT